MPSPEQDIFATLSPFITMVRGLESQGGPAFPGAGFAAFGGGQPGPWGRDYHHHYHTRRHDGPWGRRGQRGRHSDEHRARERDETAASSHTEAPDPEEVAPEDGTPRRACGSSPQAGFDINNLFRALSTHPILKEFVPSNDEGSSSEADFSPAVDTFDTESAYVLHVALPGARKEDIDVSWDADAKKLRVAGVVHRPGDEALLKTLQGEGERKVGLFDRRIGFPGDDEVDAVEITAKMDDGVLVVTVPKVEKEWTEVHRVDIE